MSGPENFDPIDVALRVAHAVDVCQGAYFVGGSLASSLHGEPTATNCIDMVLDLPIGRIKHFVNELRGDFAVDSDTLLRDTFLRGECCSAFFLPTLLKVDLFGLRRLPYDEVEFARRLPVTVRATGESLVLRTPEDTVLRKLLWISDRGLVSEQQWREVVEILCVSGASMDLLYLEGWASQMGVLEMLEQACNESVASPDPDRFTECRP